MKKSKIIYSIIVTIIYVGLLITYIYFSLSSGDDSSNLSGSLADVIANTLNKMGADITPDENFHMLVRKLIGHFGYFVLIGISSFLFYNMLKNFKFIFRLIIHFSMGFLFALFTEFGLQAIASNRGPSIIDTMIDFGGFSVSIIAILIYLLVIYKKKKTLKEI